MQALPAGHEAPHLSVDDRPRGTIWRTVARTLSVLVGLAAAAAVLVVGGFIAAVTGCVHGAEATTFCPGSEDLATTLEIMALVPGVLAPLAGGIASCVTSRPRWLVGGIAVGAGMLWILFTLASGQQSLLS